MGVLMLKCYGVFPNAKKLKLDIGWSCRPFILQLKFSLSIALSSTIWILVTQTDKLILSGILNLSEYGYFTLAAMVAGGIMFISGPVSSAIMPRMTRLHAEGKDDELIKVYKTATQLVSVIAGSVAITVAFCAETLLFAWSGDAELALNAGPILQLYAIGNGFLILSAFPYYLQYAKGNLRYHLIGNIITGLGLIPSIIYVAANHGAIGAGWVWLCFHLFGLVIWAGYVHHKIAPGIHYNWIMESFILIIAAPIFVNLIFNFIYSPKFDRLDSFLYLIAVAIVNFILTSIMYVCINRRPIK